VPAGALLLILGLALGGFVHAGPRLAEHDSSAVNVDRAGLALRGYDPVAYVVEGRAVRGRATIAWSYNGAGYRFSSTANLARFRADPERHAPQYGAFSAWHAAQGRKEAIDPRRFTIAEGRLFLHRDAASQGAWEAELARNIAAADADWPRIRYATPRALAQGERSLTESP
jgi:YHS domain-containing protein